jgi:hypothetical protein
MEDLQLWLSGKELPPHQVFMKALELAFDKAGKPAKPGRKKPGRK